MKSLCRLLVAVLSVIVLSMALCACRMPFPAETERLTEEIETVLDGILSGDRQLVRDRFAEETAFSDFDGVFDSWTQSLEGVEGFTLEPIGWRKAVENGVHTFEITCRVQSEIDGLLVRATMQDGKLVAFTLSAEDPEVEGGAVLVTNIVFYVLTGLSVALVVLMLIDCSRRKVNAKPLWLILIAIGHVEIYASLLSSETSFGIHIGDLIPFSELTVWQSGAFDLSVMLPVGAAVYFFMRKWLTEHYEEHGAAKEGDGRVASLQESDNHPDGHFESAEPSEDTKRETPDEDRKS